MTQWDFKPRTVGELLDAAFFVYRRQFVRLFLIALIVSLPALLLAVFYADDAAAALRGWWDALMQSSQQNRSGDFGKAFSDSMRAAEKLQPFALLAGVLQSIERAAGVVTMAFAATAALRREAAPPVSVIFRDAAPRLAGAVLAQLVIDNVLGACFGCCPPVGIVVTVLLSCTTVAIALERGALETSVRRAAPPAIRWAVLPFAAAIDGVARSARLTAHGPTLARGTAFVFFLLTFVFVADAAAVALGAAFAAKSGGWYWTQHCSEALVLPAWGLGVSFWYADLRVRREGLDLAVAA